MFALDKPGRGQMGSGALLVRVNYYSIPITNRAPPHHYSFIEEAHYPLISLYPLTLSHNKAPIPAFANRFIFSDLLPMIPRKAEDLFFGSTR
jgi:hypothetical protein